MLGSVTASPWRHHVVELPLLQGELAKAIVHRKQSVTSQATSADLQRRPRPPAPPAAVRMRCAGAVPGDASQVVRERGGARQSGHGAHGAGDRPRSAAAVAVAGRAGPHGRDRGVRTMSPSATRAGSRTTMESPSPWSTTQIPRTKPSASRQTRFRIMNEPSACFSGRERRSGRLSSGSRSGAAGLTVPRRQRPARRRAGRRGERQGGGPAR